MQFPQFCGASYTDQFPNADCEVAINLYLEQNSAGNSKNSSGYVMKRSPGLTEAYDNGADAVCAGLFALNGHIFAVLDTTLYDFLWDGTTLTVNASYGPVVVDGTPVQFAADPAATQLGIYSAGHVYKVEAGVLSEVVWPGVLLAGLALLNQYFLLLSADGDGFFYSEPGDIGTGDPLNFRTAEASANKFISILVDHQQVWLSGNQITQVFVNDPNDAEEPFKPNPSAVIPQGTSSGFSPVSFNNRVWWISQDGIGYRSNGYLPERISTHAIENAWRKYSNLFNDCISWTVTYNGHQCWRIWFPSGNETWEYDTALPAGKGWRKVLGWDDDAGVFTAHRGMCSTELGGYQFVGDRANGKIYVLDPDSGWDDDTRIHWDRIAPVINQENKNIAFPWFEADMQGGVGDGSNEDPDLGDVTPEANPKILMSYSNNWGRSWSNELEKSLGSAGDYNARQYIAGCGMARQRAFRIRGSAAVATVINTVYLDNPDAKAS